VTNGKGVRVQTQSSCVNKVRSLSLPRLRKENTRSRSAIIYSSFFIQFILTRVCYTVLSTWEPGRTNLSWPLLYTSLKSPSNHRVELGYFKLSEHARSEGRERSRQGWPVLRFSTGGKARGAHVVFKASLSRIQIKRLTRSASEEETSRSLSDRLPFSALF